MTDCIQQKSKIFEHTLKECIFCKIIAGEIPSTKIYEDEKVYAFLDIAPVAKGHTLIVPKTHSRNMYDIEDRDAEISITVVKKIVNAVRKSTGCDGVTVLQSNESAAGQAVFHTHFHVIPRFNDDGLQSWPRGKYEDGEPEKIGEDIKKNL